MRLFAVACLREVWHLLEDSRSREAVQAAELRVDGMLSGIDLVATQEAATAAAREATPGVNWELTWAAAWGADLNVTWSTASDIARAVAQRQAVEARKRGWSGWLSRLFPLWALAREARESAREVREFYQEGRWAPARTAAARTRQTHLLRDIIGPLPFRPVSVCSSWLTWNGGTVAQMAQAIYDERRFGDLPFLADALEEAGCDDAEMLGHCRGAGAHVRGCWVVDSLLGWE
jgi:hypothetical protein